MVNNRGAISLCASIALVGIWLLIGYILPKAKRSRKLHHEQERIVQQECIVQQGQTEGYVDSEEDAVSQAKRIGWREILPGQHLCPVCVTVGPRPSGYEPGNRHRPG